MFRKGLAAFILTTLLSWTAMAQDARTVISNASKALGAENLATIEFSGSGEDFALGQAPNPSAPWPRFINKTYTRTIDFNVPASRMSRIRMQGENPPRGGGLQPVIGEQTQNQVIVVNANTPWAQQLEIWMTPYGFLKAAATNNATVKEQTINRRKYNVVSFTGQNKAPVSAYINEQNLIDRVETRIDNPMLGDMLFEAVYSEYKDFGGVKFPTRILQRQGGYPVLQLTVTDVKPNAPANIQAPQGGAGGGAPAAATSEKLADGIYLILGGYASIAIDFKDYIVVLEGPQSEARASAIIAEAKRLIPNKPIRYVVNTHHHFDHSSGLPTFVAEGATIVTHQINKPYFERIFSAPRTIAPDKMSQSKRKPKFETVNDKKVLTDGNHIVEIHHLRGSGHNDGFLVAYLPKQKILFEADGYNPPPQPNAPAPNPASPYTLNLLENIERLKLDVDRIIAVHAPADNRRIGMAEVMRMAGKGN